MGTLEEALILPCFFFLQLAYCVVQFLEKDSSLTEPVSNLASLLCDSQVPKSFTAFSELPFFHPCCEEAGSQWHCLLDLPGSLGVEGAVLLFCKPSAFSPESFRKVGCHLPLCFRSWCSRRNRIPSCSSRAELLANERYCRDKMHDHLMEPELVGALK